MKEIKICGCGCGQNTKPGNIFILGHNRRKQRHTTEARRKLSLSHIGITYPKRQPVSDDVKRKLRNSHIGKKHTEEQKRKISEANKGKKKPPFTENHRKKCGDPRRGKTYVELYGVKQAFELKQKSKIRMLNGLALKMIKSIKKTSNEEIKLRNMVRELYPDCEFQYPVLRYSLDVAIPDKKIAIEYDGYYHFDTEEHKQYHKVRQEKIEKEGWKFLRYTIFDKFPDLEKLKGDIAECSSG